MLELIVLAVVFLLAGGTVTFKHRGRIAELEAVDREARANHAAERAELARLRDEVTGRIRAVEAREDECARLAESTAQQRQVLYKMSKSVIRDSTRTQREAHEKVCALLEEARRINGDARQQRETIADVIADPRVKRLLDERTLPSIG